MQPLLVSQLHRSQPGAQHHEEDAGQSEGDSKEGCFGFAEAVVEGHGMIGGHKQFYFNTLCATL